MALRRALDNDNQALRRLVGLINCTFKWNIFAFESQILVLPNGYLKKTCIKADLDIGATEFSFDPLLGMIRYWRPHCIILSWSVLHRDCRNKSIWLDVFFKGKGLFRPIFLALSDRSDSAPFWGTMNRQSCSQTNFWSTSWHTLKNVIVYKSSF